MAFSKKEKGVKTKSKVFFKKMKFNATITLVHLYYLFFGLLLFYFFIF